MLYEVEPEVKAKIKIYQNQIEANIAARLFGMWSRSEDHGLEFLENVKPNLMTSIEAYTYWRRNRNEIGMCVGSSPVALYEEELSVWFYRKIT